MCPSCAVIASSSWSVSASRARWATSATVFASRDIPGVSEFRHLERLAALRALHAAAADARRADAHGADGPADLALDGLEVRPESALARAGRLATDTAEVLRLAAIGLLVADHRLLAAHFTLHAHG